MSESYIILPTDGAGKKVRTVSKSISAQTVYSEFQVEDSKLNFQGAYLMCLRIAGSASAGYQYLSVYNPSGSGRVFKFKYVTISVDTGSVANQIKVTRTTSLGTGTSQTATKKHSSFSASVSNVRSALSGNATLDKDVLGIAKPTTATFKLLDVDYTTTTLEDDQIVLREVEGLVIQQLSAGAVTEYLNITVEWDEFTAT